MARSPGRLGRLLIPVAVFAAALPAAAVAGPVADPAHPELSDRLDTLDSPQLNGATPAEQADAVNLPRSGAAGLQYVGDRIVVEIRFDRGAAGARDELEAVGARILHVSSAYQTVTAAVDPDHFAEVSDVRGVESVTEALAPMVGAPDQGSDQPDGPVTGACPSGAATSEGDAKLNANALRAALSVDGSGQKVGVISDSYDRFATADTRASDDVASNDLPGPGNACGRTTPVDVVDDDRGPAGVADEGRGMLQIVHDLAPGAALAFADSGASQTEMADNIRALKNAGATVISDDITFFEEPYFQKGPIDTAVDDVNAAGVPFFSDAANMNVRNAGADVASWEAPAYRQSATCPATMPAGYTCMDFDPGPGEDPTLGVTMAAGTNRLDLQWAEPWNGVQTDLDVFVFNGATFVQSATRNLTTQRPVDVFAPNIGVAGSREIVIGRFGAAPPTSPRVKIGILQNGPQASRITEHLADGQGDVVGPQIFGHNGSENGSSVAAVNQATLATPQDYSSRGPVTHYFGAANGVTPAAPLPAPKVLQKPDITATDCTTTTFFTAGSHVFCGTSAASPHAAAIAALMKAADPTLTPAEVRALQAQNATPVGAFGPLVVGGGLISATAAAPRPRIQVNGPAGFTANNTPAITLSANRAVTFACSVDGGAAAPCSSPFAPGTVGDGAHTISVTGTDALNHTGNGTASFTVDTVPPAVNVSSGPGGPTRESQPTFGFASEPGTSVVCHFDGAAEGPCSGPDSHRPGAALADGAHSFQVVAVDAAGNRAAAGRAFSVDTAAPGVTIDSGPNGPTRDKQPTFKFSSADAGAGFLCSIDGAAAGPCSGPGTHKPPAALADGAHTFQVVAADVAGNTSPASSSFTVDTKKPTAKVKKGPKKKTPSHKATFTLSSSEKGATLKCKLDRGKFKSCKSKTTVKVKRGSHTLQVRATDAAGNAGKTVKFSWRVTR
jgi:hypothetical protein